MNIGVRTPMKGKYKGAQSVYPRVLALYTSIRVNDILALRIQRMRLCEFTRNILYGVSSLQNSVKRDPSFSPIRFRKNKFFFRVYWARYNFVIANFI